MQENTNLASEILAEVKASAKRWFIAFLIMVALEIATIAGFIYYISLPTTVRDIDIKNTEGYANYIGNNLLEDLTNGENQSDEGTESSKK